MDTREHRFARTGIRLNVSALRELFGQLEAAGLWTIRIEIPAAPEAGEARDALRANGFRMSTERLVRGL